MMEENISELIRILKTWKPNQKVKYQGEEIYIPEILAVSQNIQTTLENLTRENLYERIFEKVYQLGYQAAHVKQQKVNDMLLTLLEKHLDSEQ